MKFVANRPYADPEASARKLVEVANSVRSEEHTSELQSPA